MTDNQAPSIDDWLMQQYHSLVHAKYPKRRGGWPILSGYNVRIADLPGGLAVFFDHTGNLGFKTSQGIGDLDSATVGEPRITESNASEVRANIEREFNLGPQDGLVVLITTGEGFALPTQQLNDLLHKHEQYLGLVPMKIFLSHKGVDKEMVRRFYRLLQTLGFDPWLDDDAMPAGSQPDRAILEGFQQSCAAVFFVTPDFKDEKWLANEIEYARAQKREKGDGFSIITLCLSKGSAEGNVPELLKNYIYKSPAYELDALYEIIRALPLTLGEPRFRS